MTSQPQDDVPQCTFDNVDFEKLDTELLFRSDSQSSNEESDKYLPEYLTEPSGELLIKNKADSLINGMSDSEATMSFATPGADEELFPGCNLGIVIFHDDPIDEVTVTTTPSDAGNNNTDTINNASSELDLGAFGNLTPDQIENILKQYLDQQSLQTVDKSIQQREMDFEVQPPTGLHPRYKSDGPRQIEKSRTEPAVIKLPSLKDIELDSNQLFWLRLILTTYSRNSSDPVYLHINKLEYHSDDVQELTDETICIPLTKDDIEKGEKALSRLSIIKTKQGAYKRNLIPFTLSGIDNESHTNINEKEKASVPEAKVMFKQYNMKASRIVCQLLIQQNESWYFTNIACETDVMEEKKEKSVTKKRSAKSISSDEEEPGDERPSTSKSKSTKRKKRSNR